MRNNEWVGKRAAARKNCQMRAEMRFLDARKPIDVTIIDISASGCRIELDTDFEAPEDFDLYIPSRSETKLAKIRRQEGRVLGVAFLRSRLDDPMLMQTLLERVARLERGHADLKAHGMPAATASGSAPTGAASDVIQADDRLEALSLELAGLHLTVSEMVADAAKTGADPAIRATEFAAEMTAIKEQMAAMGEVLRTATSQAHADAPSFSADLAHMKAEMLNLSVSMRTMAAEMPKTQVVVPPSAAADSFQLAKVRADMAQLRAELGAHQSGAPAGGGAGAADMAALRAEIAELRNAVGADARPPLLLTPDEQENARLSEELKRLQETVQGLFSTCAALGNDIAETVRLKQAVARLQSAVEELQDAAANADATVGRATEIAADVAGLKAEMASLGDTLREITGRGFAESPNFSADLAHMKAEMLKLSIAMREVAAELPSVRASALPGTADHSQTEKINKDIAQLRSQVEQLRAVAGANQPGLSASSHAEIGDLKSSVHALICVVSQSLNRQRDAA